MCHNFDFQYNKWKEKTKGPIQNIVLNYKNSGNMKETQFWFLMCLLKIKKRVQIEEIFIKPV